ncbi:MAG: hypothetical protein L3J63_05405 [Geopsychrobacter sp.]|nr:hypothetical protein [Geopsychrobacter sp.]
MKPLTFEYQFRLNNGAEETYTLNLDSDSLLLQDNLPDKLPDWARLDNAKCSNCPLTTAEYPYCPAAANLVKLVENCNDLISCEQINIEVITPERKTSYYTSAQRGISSIMGLILATCGCPHTSFFRPMARFHLPLSNSEETTYRAVSMYLIGQYFEHQQNRPADLDLKGLVTIYEQVRIVNRSMATRLKGVSDEDATVNALILLDTFARSIPYAIEDSLDRIRYMFQNVGTAR